MCIQWPSGCTVSKSQGPCSLSHPLMVFSPCSCSGCPAPPCPPCLAWTPSCPCYPSSFPPWQTWAEVYSHARLKGTWASLTQTLLSVSMFLTTLSNRPKDLPPGLGKAWNTIPSFLQRALTSLRFCIFCRTNKGSPQLCLYEQLLPVQPTFHHC